MPGGFASPGILFLSTWDQPERAFCKQVFAGLRSKGYTRYVEPCAGGFAMPLIARAAGWKPEQMECSDVNLFSAVVGTTLSGGHELTGDFDSLGVQLDGQPVGIPDGSRAERGAFLLWLQLLTRMECRPDVEYWRALVTDLRDRQDEHVADIARKLAGMESRIGGMHFRAEDCWEHIKAVADDPHTVVSINPPSYACLGVDQRILTADLRWEYAGNIRVGDELVGFDEADGPRGRRQYRRSTVLRSDLALRPCVRVRLADGTSVVCTRDHPWLIGVGSQRGLRRRWINAEDLLRQNRGKPFTHRYALRAFDVWDTDESRDGGWLAGMYDGEGHLNARHGMRESETRDHASHQLGFSQKPGPVLDRFEELMLSRGFKLSQSDTGVAMSTTVTSTAEVARALGMLRPMRLLPKYPVERPCRIIDRVAIEAVEDVGMQPIQSITTSTGTYIGEGFLHHNSGFERFFETDGRLTWDEPHYAIWQPDVDLYKLSDYMEGRQALFVGQQQRVPGEASHKRPVFARHLSPGQNVYIVSNRPDEVFAITGGPKVMPRKAGEITPANFPPISMNHEITPESKVELLPVKANVADYYRNLWMHRLNAAPGSYNMLVVVDGKAAGVLGYSIDPLVRPYSLESRWERHLLMRFAFGAPHNELRLTRLVTMLTLQRRTAQAALGPNAAIWLAASAGVITVEYTKRDEAKGLRGLMKRMAKQPHPDGFKLTYAADWKDQTPAEVLAEFLRKEGQWRRSSTKNSR